MSEMLTITFDRCKAEIKHRCNTELVQQAVALFTWRPESGFPIQMVRCNPYLPDAESRKEIYSPDIPFLSEAFLYPLLGKEDARTLMALMEHVLIGVGLDPAAIQRMAWDKLDEKMKEREIAEERHKKWLALKEEKKKRNR